MIALGLALLCVVANAFFVAAEFGFAKVRPSALETHRRNGDRASRRALQITGRLDAYLSATQLGITLASLALGWLGEPAVAHYVEPVLSEMGLSPQWISGVTYGIAFGVISLLHIVLGELVPKSIAIRYPVATSRATAAALWLFYKTTAPAMWLLNGLSNGILRLMGVPPAAHGGLGVGAEELRVILDASFAQSGEQAQTRQLLERVIESAARTVRTIMVPRVDMIVVDEKDSVHTCLQRTRQHGFSRYPVCNDGDPDRVKGYVHIKDILTAELRGEARFHPLCRDVIFVPESMRVGELLTEFQRTRVPLAIVVDEYGGTEGLVTLEDVVEEIVGEIEDEHDHVAEDLAAKVRGGLPIPGNIPLVDVELDGFSWEEDTSADTLGGYVVSLLGRLARPGDRVTVGRWQVVVEDVRRRRVWRVRIEAAPEPTEPSES